MRFARVFGPALAAAVGLVFAAGPAMAQELRHDAYCGQVRWEGRAPVDAWIVMMAGNRWDAASEGAFGDDEGFGTLTQVGDRLVLRSEEAPHYVIDVTLADGGMAGTATSDRGERGTVSLRPMRPTGTGVSGLPLPPSFVDRAARRALDGDREALYQVVTWAWTPQGVDYWQGVYDNSPPLAPEAAAALGDWLRRAEAGEQPRCAF